MNALQVAIHDAVKDGMNLNTDHLLKTFNAVKDKLGGDSKITLDQVIDVLKTHKKQLLDDNE